jgi:LysM repeat protein
VLAAGDKIYLQPKRHNGDEKFHLVQDGETMWFISQSHGIQLQKLYEKNKMEPGAEPATGETIYLKSDRDFPPKLRSKLAENAVVQTTVPAPVIPSDSAALSVKSAFYTVKPGDTLYSIARHFNTTVTALKQKNNLQDSNLYIGMKLTVPQ